MPKFNDYTSLNATSPVDTVLVYDQSAAAVRQVALAALGAAQFGTIALLKAADTSAITNGQQLLVNGYYSANGSGGGEFIYDSTSVLADNGGTVIAPNSGTGRFLRVAKPYNDAREFGCVGDDATDNAVALQKAITASTAGWLVIPKGVYRTSAVLTVPSNTRITGSGVGATILTATTNNVGLFDIDGTSGSNISFLSINGASASSATPIIKLHSTGGVNCLYNRISNFEIVSMGSFGIGIDMSALSNTLFNTIENGAISGGNAGAYGSKIGIRVGGAAGTHVVSTTIIDVRVLRVNKGIQCQNCDTTHGYAIAFDDINATELEFLANGTQNRFINCRFEPDGVPAKYVDFTTSADNYVSYVPQDITTSTVTDSGIRNSWEGSVGSGGLVDKIPNPKYWTGVQTYASTLNEATIRKGAVQTPQVDAPASSAASMAWILGGTQNSVGPGGSNITHNFLFPFTALHPAMYLASCLAVSTGGTRAARLSLFVEPVSGTLVEINISNAVVGGASVAFVVARTGNDITFECDVLTNDGNAGHVTRNFIRLN